MKNLIILLFFAFGLNQVLGQQLNRTDDSLLLEYYQTQHFQMAADYLKKTFPEPVTNIKVLNQMAYSNQMANHLPEAQAYFERIYNTDTTNVSALLAMATINQRRGNANKTELYLKKVLLRDSTNIFVFTKLAAIAVDKHDTLTALNYLQKANQLNSNDAEIAVDLSNLYIPLKRFDDALAVLKKAATADPENVYLLNGLVLLYYKQKKWCETVNACLKLIAMNVADGQLMYKLGVAYFNLKNYACGAEILSSLQGQDQTEFSCYFAGICYKHLNDYKQSTVWLNKAIQQGLSANIASYYGEIADNNEQQYLYTKAVIAYQKSLQFGASPAIYTALGDLYSKKLKNKLLAKKYYQMAAAAYRRALDNGNEIDIYVLASLYDTQLKDTANAIKYYREYLDTKPPGAQQKFIDYTSSRIGQLQK